MKWGFPPSFHALKVNTNIEELILLCLQQNTKYVHVVTKTFTREEAKMGKIIVNEKFCKGCALCVETCAQHLIRIAKHITPEGYHPAEFVDPEEKCTGCTLCALVCPDVAIEVYRQTKKETI